MYYLCLRCSTFEAYVAFHTLFVIRVFGDEEEEEKKKNDKCVNLTQEVAVQFPTELLFC